MGKRRTYGRVLKKGRHTSNLEITFRSTEAQKEGELTMASCGREKMFALDGPSGSSRGARRPWESSSLGRKKKKRMNPLSLFYLISQWMLSNKSQTYFSNNEFNFIAGLRSNCQEPEAFDKFIWQSKCWYYTNLRNHNPNTHPSHLTAFGCSCFSPKFLFSFF